MSENTILETPERRKQKALQILENFQERIYLFIVDKQKGIARGATAQSIADLPPGLEDLLRTSEAISVDTPNTWLNAYGNLLGSVQTLLHDIPEAKLIIDSITVLTEKMDELRVEESEQELLMKKIDELIDILRN